MVDLARLENLKRLLNDGTLTREEFEALKQKELQADGTDRGDCGSDCASERSASPAPVIGAPVYGAATGNAVPGAPGASTTPTLAEKGAVFRRELGVAGANLVELVEASCVALGVSVKGKSLAQQADECWRILQSPRGAHLPAGRASAGACSDSKRVGGMKTTDPFAVPATHGDDPHERISERLSRARVSAASFTSRRSSTCVAPVITKPASSASSGLVVDTEAGKVPPDRAESEGERLSSSRSSAAGPAAAEQSSSQSSAAEQSKQTTRPPKQKLFSNPFSLQPWCPPTNRKAPEQSSSRVSAAASAAPEQSGSGAPPAGPAAPEQSGARHSALQRSTLYILYTLVAGSADPEQSGSRVSAAGSAAPEQSGSGALPAGSAAPGKSKETAGAVGFLRSKVGCLRMLIRVLSLTLFATWVATLVVCNAYWDEGFFGDGGSVSWNQRRTMRMVAAVLIFPQGIIIVAARAALLLQVQQIGRRRVYGSLVLASALLAVGSLITLLMFGVSHDYQYQDAVRFGLKYAIYGSLMPAQILELTAFVLFVPVVPEWRRRAIFCAAWGAITITATVAVICVYEGRAMAGVWGRFYYRDTVADSNVEAFRWSAAILAPSYYLADITSAINRPQVAALTLCPPMNRKATAKRLGIALLLFFVVASVLAGVIYLGLCRTQSVFTSREDLRREIELYDSVCGSLFGNPIGSWDVSAVTDMSYSFSPYGYGGRYNYPGLSVDFSLRTFNQDISAWNVSAVTTMRSMFASAVSFNQDISAWNVSAVTDMSDMFHGASSFDKTLCSDAWRASPSQSWTVFYGTNGAGICE